MILPFVSREAYNQVAERLMEAQDEVRLLRTRLSMLEDQRDEAIRESLHSRELVADWLSQHTFGTRIYAAAPALPETAPNEGIEELNLSQRRSSARSRIKELETEFQRALAQRQGANLANQDFLLSQVKVS